MTEQEMHAKEKLEECRYFLDELRRTSQTPKNFNYNLSAFLSAWRSVMDIMLYDFAEKYSLGLSREDRFTDDGFGIAAKALKHIEALNFLEWWRREIGRLSQNPLSHKRKMIVHRGYPPTVRDYTVEVSTPGTSFTYGGARYGFSTYTAASQVAWSSSASPREAGSYSTFADYSLGLPASAVDIRFPDFPERSALDVCHEAFDDMRRIVETAERNYWNKP
jgi:hypothetical protein